jgi:uncharacterized membrane protein YdjX (TVP38/TMEM64 family)
VKQRYRLSKRILDGAWVFFVKVRYPKILMLAGIALLAFWSFRMESVQSFFHSLGDLGYLSAFFGGSLFAFGFGAPFGVALLLTIADDVNIFLGGIIGGLGALLSDYLLFRFIRVTFADEIERLKGSKPFGFFNGFVRQTLPPKAVFYASAGIAGLIIASPLPDEIGVTILAGLANVSDRAFAIVSFTLNTLGILTVLGAGYVF